jgi:nucleoside-triphosphatase
VIAALDSDSPVLGTIHRRSTPFIDAIKSRPDVTVIEVTYANRDDLPGQIVNMLADESA